MVQSVRHDAGLVNLFGREKMIPIPNLHTTHGLDINTIRDNPLLLPVTLGQDGQIGEQQAISRILIAPRSGMHNGLLRMKDVPKKVYQIIDHNVVRMHIGLILDHPGGEITLLMMANEHSLTGE
jgi:hypothetical protein